jgi:amidophosphoribosyltransferase
VNELHEKCGVFGVWSKNPGAARLVYPGLWALQHRGQESSGIASSDGYKFYSHVGQGLVAQVYGEEYLERLVGNIAIGHNRYSTSKKSENQHFQPIIPGRKSLAFAHNGNLPSTKALEAFLTSKGMPIHDRNDSEMMADAIDYYYARGASLADAVEQAYPLFTGAFSCVVMDKDTLVAFRDSAGLRPLSIGVLVDGFAVSSETCAFETIGAAYLQEIKPGEMVEISAQGIRFHEIVAGTQKLDIFEFIYFARPDSRLLNRSVNEVRRNLGMELARESHVEADVIIPVPDSAIPAAIGYAAQSGVPFDHGLIKNRYIHRTFIRPAQSSRESDVSLKLNPMPEVLMGKRVVVIDDSIVRGTTTRKLVDMLQRAGTKEVHLRISSPPVKFPDFYGIDTPNQQDLIAATKSVEEIREYVGADSLAYLSYDGMIKATGLPEDVFSTSCFTGVYPIDLGERVNEFQASA